MGQGYLGKISTVLSVSTADIPGKIQSGFVGPMEKALRSIETTLRNTNRSVEKSLNDIYTPAQKVARAIAAAQMGAVKAFDGDSFAKKLQIRDDISEPVKRLAQEIEKTSGILRGNFEPRIVALQAESQALFDKMAADASSVASGEITSLIAKVNQLGAAFKSAGESAEGWEKLSAIGRGDKGTRGTDLMFAGLGEASRRAVAQVEGRAAQDAAAEEAARARRAAQFAGLGAAGRDALGTSQRFANLGADSRRAVENLSVNRTSQSEMEAQERRIWAIRDAEQEAFEQRQQAAARAIHEEEQAAIRRERAEREAGDRQAQEAVQAELRAREAIRQQIASDFQDRQRRTAQMIHDEEQAAIEQERRDREAAARQQEMLDENAARARDAAQRQRQADLDAQRAEAARMAGQVAAARRGNTDEFRESFGGRGAAGINLGLDRNALAASTAELQIIQRAIGRAAADARGPAVEAFIRLRNAIADAFENGSIEAEGTRRNLARLRTEAVNAAAQVGGVNRRTLARDVTRAGDVSRGGLDKFGLAVQQAGFAIDDFFSSTGGLDMRIRAVSNNISQMAFILGGTAGLFTGLAFTVGSQVVVQMLKFADAGRTSADRIKALNDALEAQQNLVRALSESYRELAKSFSAAMSQQGQKAAGREKLFGDVASKRKQATEEGIYSADVGVAGARASVVVAENALKKASTVSAAKVAEMQLKIAKQQEEMAKADALGRARAYNNFVGVGPAAGNSVQAGIQTAIERFGQMRMVNMDEGERRIFGEFIRAQMAAVPAAGNREDAANQLRAFIEDQVRNNDLLQNPELRAGNIVGDLLEQLARLEFGLKEANASLIDDVNRSLAGTSDVLENAQKTIGGAGMETEGVANVRTRIDQVAASLEALSIAASETTDKDVLDAIAADAEAARALGDELGKAAREARDFADALQKAIAEENAAAERGVDLGKVRSGFDKANDIRAAAANVVGDAARRDFINQAFRNVAMDTATVMRGFEEERQNAILGGPSRQALNASDISTGEGQRELNRLLRGDDPSRDVNFVEMQRQTDLLSQIAEGIKQATGIVVDFR